MKFPIILSFVAATMASKPPLILLKGNNAVPGAFEEDDLVVYTKPASISFGVQSENEPVSSAMKDAFVNSCLSSSFSAVTDPRKYVPQGVEIMQESITEEERTVSVSNNLGKLGWNWYYFSGFIYGSCRLCLPDKISFSQDTVQLNDPSSWEAGFCDSLEAGPYEDLQTATGCTIRFDDNDDKDELAMKKIPLLRGSIS